MPIDEQDMTAIRIKSRILPESVPDKPIAPPAPATPAPPPDATATVEPMPMDQAEQDQAALRARIAEDLHLLMELDTDGSHSAFADLYQPYP